MTELEKELVAALLAMLDTCAVNLDDQEPNDLKVYADARATLARISASADSHVGEMLRESGIYPDPKSSDPVERMYGEAFDAENRYGEAPLSDELHASLEEALSEDDASAGFLFVTGNPRDGFTYIGPFEEHDQAVSFADSHSWVDAWWIAPLASAE